MLAPQAADPFEGTPYRNLGPLGAGGMGEVFLVQHREIGNEFVAKVRRSHLDGDPRTLERMRIEAQALGQLRHRHIVAITAIGRTREGRPYIITEHLRGRTLRQELVARGRLPVLEAVTYTCELLSALEAAHAIDIVHRDIKPDNLFLCDVAGRRLLKVLDFGVARVASDSSPVKPLPADCQTNTGEIVGTPVWQSPEGAMGARVDARADLYAAALVLYALIAGRGPFDHFESDSMVLSAHAVEDPEPPSRYAQDPIPVELDRAILKALRKDPHRRFQTATEFRGALLQVAELLQRPSGWLETTAFVIERTAAQSSDSSSGPRPAAGAPAMLQQDDPEAHDARGPEPSVYVPREHRAPAGALQHAQVPGVDRRGLILAVLAFVVAGAVTAWLVALLSGGP